MKIPVLPRLLSITFLASLPLAVFAAETIPVYTAKDGFADGWKTGSWNGPVIDEIPASAPGTSLLRVELKNGSQPFCGVVLSSGSSTGFFLTESLRKSGVVTIRFAPGKTPQGEAASTSQPIQVALSFLAVDGHTVHAPFKDQASVPVSPEGGNVSFTVADAIRNVKVSPEQLAAISAVRIQFIGQPVSGFNILECSIQAE